MYSSFDHGVVHSVTLLQVILSRMAMRGIACASSPLPPSDQSGDGCNGASGIHAYIWRRIEKVPHTSEREDLTYI
jgi:hypothetical protein